MPSVPWDRIEEALFEAGPLDGKIIIDTTNQFGVGGSGDIPGGLSATEFNAGRAAGVRLVKAYNTMTAGFQAEAAGRTYPVPMFYAGEDKAVKTVVAGLMRDSGFEPVDAGGWKEVWIMEAPRRRGAVYGKEYRPEEAREIAKALKNGSPEETSRLAHEKKVDGY